MLSDFRQNMRDCIFQFFSFGFDAFIEGRMKLWWILHSVAKVGEVFNRDYGFFVAPILEHKPVLVKQLFQVGRLVINNSAMKNQVVVTMHNINRVCLNTLKPFNCFIRSVFASFSLKKTLPQNEEPSSSLLWNLSWLYVFHFADLSRSFGGKTPVSQMIAVT